jgi:hypothetical protein
VLVGFAFSVFVRSLHGWWRLLAVPAAFVLVQLVLVPITPPVYATHVPSTTIGRTTPAELGLDYIDVEFATADGAMLSGWYLPSSNGAASALLHGSGSTRSAVLDHATVRARPRHSSPCTGAHPVARRGESAGTEAGLAHPCPW